MIQLLRYARDVALLVVIVPCLKQSLVPAKLTSEIVQTQVESWWLMLLNVLGSK